MHCIYLKKMLIWIGTITLAEIVFFVQVKPTRGRATVRTKTSRWRTTVLSMSAVAFRSYAVSSICINNNNRDWVRWRQATQCLAASLWGKPNTPHRWGSPTLTNRCNLTDGLMSRVRRYHNRRAMSQLTNLTFNSIATQWLLMTPFHQIWCWAYFCNC